MHTIAKSLILYGNDKKYTVYMQEFHAFYIERNPAFDRLIDLIGDFFSRYEVIPTVQALQTEATQSNDLELAQFLSTVLGDTTARAIDDDSEFFAYVKSNTSALFQLEASQMFRQGADALASLGDISNEKIAELMEEYSSRLAMMRNKGAGSQNAVSFVTSHQGSDDLKKIYVRNLRAKRENKRIFYPMASLPGMESIDTKRGDLVYFCAFTSQGKSILLRLCSYFFAIHYQFNMVFVSLEMPAEVVRIMFSLLHANNKKIFPNTPKVAYDAFKKGELTDEELDFLFNVAEQDLLNNPAYGTIHIHQPADTMYTPTDLRNDLKDIETNIMPVDGLGLDYPTLMTPDGFRSGRSPDRTDYNNMIKQIKLLLMNHKLSNGQPHPLLGFAAAQISRQGYDDAVKDEGVYTLKAIQEFSEIEKSSDILFTSMMTPEMKTAKTIRIQNLKYRDGAVVINPVDNSIDLAYGQGMEKLSSISTEDTVAALQQLDI